MTNEAILALLSILATLVGALVWVVKKSGDQNGRLIVSLTAAVEAFKQFEMSEDAIHERIVATQERIIDKLDVMAQEQQAIAKDVRQLREENHGRRADE